ncbi:MAG: PhnD/SsuA/transferrin family substrate-binding protein [Bacilli bacterium]|nr:PhnD/SsuA/transferrin family substrate-binding protein [Bacilli bacterium]
MKHTSKSVLLLGLMSLSALASCGGSAESKEIHVQLVPSNDSTVLLNMATKLTPYLNEYVKDTGYTFKIDVGTSYAATTSALAAGQIDGGFLTASGYAQCTIDTPNKVKVVLSASRAGYKVQADDFPGFTAEAKELQRAAMNGEVTKDGKAVTKDNASNAYVYRGEQSATEVSFYSAIMITLRDSARAELKLPALDSDGDGKTTIKEIKDNNGIVGVMGATSSAGYIYPTYTIHQKGYTKGFYAKNDYDALSAADKEKAMISAEQASYSEGVAALMEGRIDAMCGYMDIRYGGAFVQDSSKYYKDETLFTKGYCVEVMDPIMNDTVSVRADLSQDKIDAIKKAFKAAAKDGAKDKENTAAYYLYQIYSHTGYVDAQDSDYESARSMYKWTLQNTK